MIKILIFAAVILTPLISAASETFSVSRSDMNRIVCTSEVESVYFSEEKGLSVSTSGKDAYVKFPVKITVDPETQEQRTQYASAPAEIFIVCGDMTHSLLLSPAKIAAQTIVLKKEEAETVAEYKGKDEEETISLMMKALIEEAVPASFRKTEVNRTGDAVRGDRVLKYIFINEYVGGGYKLKEYHIYSAEEITILPSELSMFDENAAVPLAAMLTSETFSGWVRAFIIERGVK